MIHFIRPYWLLIILPAFLYLIWVIYSQRHHNPWQKVCDPHLLPALLQKNPYTLQRLFYFLLFSLYTIGVIALAGPAWKKIHIPLYRELNSWVIVLDLSDSMNNVDLKPDRLTRAKFKIRDLINAAQNAQMGLVAFTAEAFIASPLSQDVNTVSALLDELDPSMMPVSGSDSGQGLVEGYQLLKQTNVMHGNLLLITASHPTANSWRVAKHIGEHGGHVHVLAMLDNKTNNKSIIENLQQLAKIGKGKFSLFTSTNSTDIQFIFNNVTTKPTMNNMHQTYATVWQDTGPWLCLLLIPIALLVLRENKST